MRRVRNTGKSKAKLAPIVDLVIPKRLYRYRSLDQFEREIGAIEEGYVYCAPYIRSNDPMEGMFAPSRGLRESSRYEAVRRAVIENKTNMGICSFSEVYDHELMWAHYAGRFSGICVAYSFRRLRENLGPDYEFARIYYNEAEPTITDNIESSRLAKMVLSCKAYRWLYEREWRMFGRAGRAIYGRPDCVTRVYLGFRIDPGKRELLTERLTRLRIETKCMRIDKYFMDFERCHHSEGHS